MSSSSSSDDDSSAYTLDEDEDEVVVEPWYKKGKAPLRGSITGSNIRDLSDTYTVGPMIGSGTSGKVCRGVNKTTGQVVALKFLEKSDHPPNSIARRNIIREMRIMKAIQHPNVVQLFDAFETDTQLVLVMEYAVGGDLFDDTVKKNGQPLGVAREIMRQIVRTVAFLHSKGIAHRDLKTENILLMNTPDQPPLIKICDFGFSCFQTAHGGMTLMQSICGSLLYAAPEVFTKQQGGYDFKVDVFSVGVIAYILLTGRMPYANDDPIVTIRNKYRELHFDPQYWGSVPADAREFVRECMAPEPSQRPSAAELLGRGWLHDPVDVYPAGPVHVPALAPLFDHYRQFYAKPPDLQAATAFLTERLTTQTSVVFMASVGGAVAGFAQIYPSFSSLALRPRLILYDLFVESQFRRRGVAQSLLLYVHRYAQSVGASEVALETARTNTAAQALYRKLGWVEDNEFLTFNLTVETKN